MVKEYSNILLVSGSGRKAGKTTFICSIISNLKKEQIMAVKISSHFHEPTHGLIKFSEGDGWKISEETNTKSTKDSSLFLQTGAIKSYYIQADKNKISKVVNELEKILPGDLPVIIESGGLNKFLNPGILVKIIRNDHIEKEAGINTYPDSLIINSDGKTFKPGSEIIIFDKGWKIRK